MSQGILLQGEVAREDIGGGWCTLLVLMDIYKLLGYSVPLETMVLMHEVD